MKLKKCNAVFALLSALALFIHMAYNIYAYLTFYYNPSLKTLTSLPFIICTCVHAVCGMCAVFLLGDGTRLDLYRKQNRQTVIQRVSAALIFPLLILHLKTFSLLKTMSTDGKWFPFVLLIILQTVFYLVTLTHTAVSLSKALITLGLLTDREKQKKLDRTVYVFCAVLLLTAVFAVISGELKMFLPK